MNELLKAIYDCLYTRKDATDTVAEIEDCHRQLIERLDKPERKLVLQIIDGKDRIADELSIVASPVTMNFRVTATPSSTRKPSCRSTLMTTASATPCSSWTMVTPAPILTDRTGSA